MSGHYLCLEGFEACGKSTMVAFIHEYFGPHDSILTRHPGSTPLGVELRQLIKHREDIKIDLFTEQILFMADHNAFVETILKPALENNKIVIADRHNLIGNLAYGYARKDNFNSMWKLRAIFEEKTPKIDYLFLLDCEWDILKQRLLTRDHKCKIEARGDEYLKRVHQIYSSVFSEPDSEIALKLNKIAKKIVRIDASKPLEEVKEEIKKHLKTIKEERIKWKI